MSLSRAQYFITSLLREAAKLEDSIFYKALGKVEYNSTIVSIISACEFSSFVQHTRKHKIALFIPTDAHIKISHTDRFTHTYHSLDIKYLIHNDESVYKSSYFFYKLQNSSIRLRRILFWYLYNITAIFQHNSCLYCHACVCRYCQIWSTPHKI